MKYLVLLTLPVSCGQPLNKSRIREVSSLDQTNSAPVDTTNSLGEYQRTSTCGFDICPEDVVDGSVYGLTRMGSMESCSLDLVEMSCLALPQEEAQYAQDCQGWGGVTITCNCSVAYCNFWPGV